MLDTVPVTVASVISTAPAEGFLTSPLMVTPLLITKEPLVFSGAAVLVPPVKNSISPLMVPLEIVTSGIFEESKRLELSIPMVIFPLMVPPVISVFPHCPL